jgi:hypothetical protein
MLAHLHVNVLPHTARRPASNKALLLQKCDIKLNPFLNNCGLQDAERPPRTRYETFYCHAAMSTTFLCPARLPLCIRLGRSERPCAPSGIEKASVFRCPIEQFSRRIARKPVSMFQPYSLQRHQPRRT